MRRFCFGKNSCVCKEGEVLEDFVYSRLANREPQPLSHQLHLLLQQHPDFGSSQACNYNFYPKISFTAAKITSVAMEKILRCVKQCGMIEQIGGQIELWILQKIESLLDGAEQFKDDFAIAQFELHLLKEINKEFAKMKGKQNNIEGLYVFGPITFAFVVPPSQLVSSAALGLINKIITTYQILGNERLLFQITLNHIKGKQDPLQTAKLRISIRDEIHK